MLDWIDRYDRWDGMAWHGIDRRGAERRRDETRRDERGREEERMGENGNLGEESGIVKSFALLS